ncbi:hypothetical protein TWF506_004560 [Arthrobotrys conoides]|uniref:Uncharacterized protein n=1 Tax=Arthrobotrys conoides TaxID=74498 RepID=A0AAN8N9K4_9PEZI
MEFTFTFGASAPTAAAVPATSTATTATTTAAVPAPATGLSTPVTPKQRKIAACRVKKTVSLAVPTTSSFDFNYPCTPAPVAAPSFPVTPSPPTPMELSTPMPSPMEISTPMEAPCFIPPPIPSGIIRPSLNAFFASVVAQFPVASSSAMKIKAVRVPRPKTEAELLCEENERVKKQWEIKCAKEAAWEGMALRAFPPVPRTKISMKPASFWVNLTPTHKVQVGSGYKAPVVSAARSKSSGIEAGQQWFNRNTAKYELERMLAIERIEREAKEKREAETAAKIASALDGLSACVERKPTFVERAISAVAPFVPLARYVVPFMTYITMEILQH